MPINPNAAPSSMETDGPTATQNTQGNQPSLSKTASAVTKALVSVGGSQTTAHSLSKIPVDLFIIDIATKLDSASVRALSSSNKKLHSLVHPTSRQVNIRELRSTLHEINNEKPHANRLINTDTLVLSGAPTLDDFKNLPSSPKIRKLVLEFSSSTQNNDEQTIRQESVLGIHTTFPNLTHIDSNGLTNASGRIVSEILRGTNTLKSLSLRNIKNQEDTLSGPLHDLTENSLTELTYSEHPSTTSYALDSPDSTLLSIQLDKLLDSSKHLKTLSLASSVNLSKATPAVQARCQKIQTMKNLEQFEMKHSPKMAENYLAYMLSESSKLKRIELTENPFGVGVSLDTLLGTRQDNGQRVLPNIEHITYWNNAGNNPTNTPHLTSPISFFNQLNLDRQVEGSLTQLGTHHQRLASLKLKVSNGVKEEAVMEASQCLKLQGTLVLGGSKNVSHATVEKIQAKRPDLSITLEA